MNDEHQSAAPAAARGRQELEALRESEARFRQLADNLPHGFICQIVEDAAGVRFSYVSGSVEALLGVTPAQATADPDLLYGMILEEDLPRMRAAEDEAYRQRKPFDCQFRMRTPGGRMRWLHCRAAPREGGERPIPGPRAHGGRPRRHGSGS